MRILITAGATEIPIDRVRSISNIFKGRTGLDIARYLDSVGIEITLLTSGHQELKPDLSFRFRSISFRTFDELAWLMEQEIRSGGYDAVIHSAAVSDYAVSRILVLRGGTLTPVKPKRKISSSYDHLYLELMPTIKLIDQIREPCGFRGKLVKFKLQVGISDKRLIAIARESMFASEADFVVANCLEWYRERAYIIGADGSCENVRRSDLAAALQRRLA